MASRLNSTYRTDTMVRLHLRIPMNPAGHSGKPLRPVEPRGGLSELPMLAGHAKAALSAARMSALRIAWSAGGRRRA
jgi:hypothetical protein